MAREPWLATFLILLLTLRHSGEKKKVIKYAFIALFIGLVIHRIGLTWIFGIVRAFFWLGLCAVTALDSFCAWLNHVL